MGEVLFIALSWIPAFAHTRQLKVLGPTGLNNIAHKPVTAAFMHPFQGTNV
jgi:hypothetical protein